MESASFLCASVCRLAATLIERVHALRTSPGPGTQVPHDAERGRRRLEQWRAQQPFSRDGLFGQRLAQAGLTEIELQNLLSEGDRTESESSCEPPAWAMELEESFAQPCLLDAPDDASRGPPGCAVLAPFPEGRRERTAAGLLEVIRPLLGRAVARLREGVRHVAAGSHELPFDPDTVDEILFGPLPGRLLSMMLRTLTLELHVARLRGRLHGGTAELRFQSFVQRLRRREVARELFREYPVLARQVVLCMDNWFAAGIEFLQRWCRDWPTIRAAFSPDTDPGPLVAIRADAGDCHRGGRSVIIARCRSGLQVVYKPRSLAVDQHFQDLLGWLNDRGACPPFRQLRVVERGSYGWVEFVSPSACASAEQVELFYRRQGGYVALLYALAATDFHFENVIAAGDEPVLIDLEAIFTPAAQEPPVKPADHLAGTALDESVLGTGLLPQSIRLDFDGRALDLSGLAAEPGRELPWRQPGFTGQGTDEMRFERMKDVIQSSDHRPTLGGAVVQALDHAAVIEVGFRHVYELLARHRAELLAAGGLLDRFADDEVRVLLRSTSHYREFLDEGFHPDVLRDALDRDRLFDRLWEGVEEWPRQARFIPAEVEDLWRGDIPSFSTRPASRDLFGGAGQRFANEFRETGVERVRRRLGQFGAADLARQLWFLRASLTTLATDAGAAAQPGYRLTGNAPAADPQRLLAASRAVGDWLAEHAIHGPAGDVNWIGLTLVRDEQWCLLPLGMDLYDGVPGVAFFLAYLGAITGAERYTTLARGALKTLRRRLLPQKRLKTVRCLGGFAGWGGVLYVLAHLGRLWGEPAILAEAEELVTVLPDLIGQDKYLDIGLGAGGCIAGLCALHRCTPAKATEAAAVQCGDHLLARARPMPQGVAWDWPFPSRGPLTGYPHGAAGIAVALSELAAETGEERFRAAARGAIDYERGLFSAQEGNWPDLRVFGTAVETAAEAPLRYSTTWCYGAPGIGLARLRCLGHLHDPTLRTEIDTALRTTQAKGFGLSHILCHGDLGNLELLLEAAHAFPESAWQAEVDRLTAGILNSIERDGWLCANPMNLESPGLMTGLAGIGHQLLRLAAPARVPSVLTLAPPVLAPHDLRSPSL
jgi:type 2 lantibiotic biosynthesis protein LanM